MFTNSVCVLYNPTYLLGTIPIVKPGRKTAHNVKSNKPVNTHLLTHIVVDHGGARYKGRFFERTAPLTVFNGFVPVMF